MNWRLLTDVPDEEVRLLLSVARRRRFSAGEVVFHRDDPGDSLHLIVEGRLAIRIMTPVGETVTIGIRGPGESFGEMALVGSGARRSATVVSLDRAETFSIHKPEFDRLRRKHPAVNEVLIAFLAGEVRRQNQLLLEALYVPAERRLLRRLSELASIYPASDDGEIVVPLKQEELAELAGTSRATTNRVLREEQERGTITLRRGRTVVVDQEALTARAR